MHNKLHNKYTTKITFQFLNALPTCFRSHKQTNKRKTKRFSFRFVSFLFISSTRKSVFTFLLISSAWGTACAERAAHNNIIIEFFFLPLVLFSIQTYHSIVHTCLTHECIRIELIGFTNQRRTGMGEGMRERI